MIGRSSSPSCLKCGSPVTVGAGFCSNCGTQIGDVPFSSDPADPEKRLTSNNPGGGPDDAQVRADGPFQTGQKIGPRYTILELLGTGGMGAVYQAFDHELGAAVAIKVIRPSAQSDATAAKELEQRFKRELVLARQVTHKHVVRIHDLGEIDGIKYLTMPFVEGETLAQVLRRAGTPPVSRAIQIAIQIAQGLAAAHEKGVIHRDLKPENIMIEQSSEAPVPGGGDALIMDFGIARSVQHGATQTAAGAVIGTLEYMAPEQAQGGQVDHRADQYAFGLIFYDMLVGRGRLAQRDNSMTELLTRLRSTPPAPRTINPEITEPVNQIVMRCLQPTPEARYATTADLAHALERLTPDGHLRTDLHDVVTLPAPPRPRWQLALTRVIIAAFAGTVGWLILNQSAAPPVAVVRDPISVLIADFNNKTGDPVFDGVVEQALGLGIEGASFITAYPRRDALRAAAVIKPGATLDETTARLVARREGVGVVLAGEIEQRGSAYHIITRGLASGDDGPPLYTLEADAGGKSAILETVGALAGKVRTALGDSTVPPNGPAASETFTAASLEAAQAYAKGQALQAAGRREEAIIEYEEAVRLDPNMGRAYSGIAVQHVSLGRTEMADQYYAKALTLIDRMTDREKYRTRGGYFLFKRKAPAAIKEYTALLQAFPGDGVARLGLAVAHLYNRNMAEAREEGRKAAEFAPMNVSARNNAALYAMYSGEFETAIAGSDEARKLNPAYVLAFLARALSEVALGRPIDAVKTYEKLKGVSAVGASFAVAGLADVALYEGRTQDAIALLKGGIASDTAAKNVTGLALKHVAMAEALFARGDPPGAAREAELALAVDQSDPVALTAGLMLAKIGKTAAAQQAADILAKRLEVDPQAYSHLIQAELSLVQRRGGAALEHARQAQKLADTWLGRLILARSYLELSAFGEASSEIGVAIERLGEATAVTLDEWPTFRYFAPVHYYLGRAQEGVKSPAAAASYKTFLDIKQRGDEAGGLVADARRRLAAQ
jgi:serine/threonine protein kinase/tetratricopeptide (TPR) repeat protein